MTLDEFKFGIERLRSREIWTKSLDASFAQILWKKVRNFSWQAFQAGIDDLLSQHNKPTVQDIVSACANASRGIASTIGRSANYEKPWISSQAPGTPAHLEALFLIFKNGEKSEGILERTLRRLKISSEEFHEMYAFWTIGKVHERTKRQKAPSFESLTEQGGAA